MSSSLDEEQYWRRRRELLTEQQQMQKCRQRRGWVGSKPGKAPNFYRERVKFHYQLMKDYFDHNPTYNARLFRRRFRMRQELFERIKEEMPRNHYDHFRTKVNPVDGLTGFTVEQKMTAALRVLAYGGAADQQDDLGHFCNAVISSFSSFHLRLPTADDLEYILSLHSSQGFPRRLGSIDVMHWEWKNCPTSWAGQYKLGKNEKPTDTLEAVEDARLWCWHCFLGVPGGNNDLNILDRSPLLTDLMHGRAPEVAFHVNGNSHRMGYYLDDCIYPDWKVFRKSIKRPRGEKEKNYAERQEGDRKDVERFFAALQNQFHIIQYPCNLWDDKAMSSILLCCVILHNMIIEDEWGQELEKLTKTDDFDVKEFQKGDEVQSQIKFQEVPQEYMNFEAHYNLRHDLMEHLWDLKYRRKK